MRINTTWNIVANFAVALTLCSHRSEQQRTTKQALQAKVNFTKSDNKSAAKTSDCFAKIFNTLTIYTLWRKRIKNFLQNDFLAANCMHTSDGVNKQPAKQINSSRHVDTSSKNSNKGGNRNIKEHTQWSSRRMSNLKFFTKIFQYSEAKSEHF